MPIHDWTRVSAGTFHDFHLAWIAELRRVLNSGLLPSGYYAQVEQVAGQIVPDVLALQEVGSGHGVTDWQPSPADDRGGVAVAEQEPRVSLHETISEAQLLAARRRRLVIRNSTDDRIVALVEIVSPGNKDRRGSVEAFVDKVLGALAAKYHLLVLDLLPPGPADAGDDGGRANAGIHGAVWRRLGGWYAMPKDKPLTLAAYVAADPVSCYVEPTAVGTPLIEMPLFYRPDRYINVPLEPTYQAAYAGVPERWRRVIEGR